MAYWIGDKLHCFIAISVLEFLKVLDDPNAILENHPSPLKFQDSTRPDATE